MNYKQESERLFDGLFVLELANNHWGNVDRGLRIITDFSRIVRFNNVKASIKLQFRDVDRFVHRDFRERSDIRYIKKTLDTQMSVDDYKRLIDAVRASGCIPMSTPFDEESVRLCVRLGVEIIKIASSDLNDWVLIEEIAKTRKPVIVSTGGSSLKDVDDLAKFFRNRHIPLAINHCVSIYPSEDQELEINQVDFLRDRYPDHVIGFSTHEKTDWTSSVMIAYAKGARTFERHIDIEADGIPVSPYCTLPDQADVWFKAYKKAVEMCGAPGTAKRIPPQKEIAYLDGLVRGVYAKRDLMAGAELLADDYYLAIPLQKGQMSCRELMNGERLLEPVTAHAPIRVTQIDSPYAQSAALRETIEQRGL
ncbi:N-acetylneuraminate synthase family protein [Burkholderia contaminans]|uniref:Spore coat polysaccharide biosynthesis protein SpsE n=1 Tax=Burkholderia contaminans TaxID=488447 RepID=A0A6P2ZLK0_9BURK|nr:N-acetylneuraminate synthase family protein [Burkholderia contaminans]VWD23129.1 Spore coat polysaccharide biosynthesis protein SpsE [Burkholderia contaminans]VWD35470.1 Spore coat polysaccharide biosynthesis protein SpsE [Burkholderia contaminans]